ncbi:uncharacterized protein LOC131884701 isoform X2 [Tigriopus californicus]|nr:uncharacterized protein LOC131884701 isoform X2 [Tigriopus californicus]XP_059088536.1 uncharacterized protein LOC131884701 isoform X2 [Tigriopus californicus]
MSTTIMGRMGVGRGPKEEDYHSMYQKEAKPYSDINFDKDLAYVPRYRYPISSYVGKRMKSPEETDPYRRGPVYGPLSQLLRDLLSRFRGGEDEGDIFKK